MNIRNNLKDIVLKYDLYDVQLSLLNGNDVIIDECCISKRKNKMWTIVPESKFRVASVSKILVSIGIMKLHEIGQISINSPVDKYLNFRVVNPYFANTPITIKMLLTHTSSIVDSMYYFDHQNSDMRELFETDGKYNTNDLYLSYNNKYIEPGKKFAYSNIGFMLLGTLIEQVTKKRFDTFIDELIISPLNIDGTFNIHDLEPSKYYQIHPPMRKVDGLWIAQTDNFEQLRGKYDDYVVGSNASILAPQGGFRTNSRELLKLMKVFRPGTNHILKPETIKMMIEPYVFEHDTDDHYDYCYMRSLGLGIVIDKETKNVKYIGHIGDAYGLNALCYYSPLLDYSFSFISIGKNEDLTMYKKKGSLFLNFQQEILELIDNIVDNLSD